MEEYDFVQIVYHTDFAKKNSEFIDSGTLLESKEDGNWCGRGMYFWDNLSNAKYWQDKKKRRFNCNVTISKSSLRYHEKDILDLTDDKTAQELYRVAVLYKKRTGLNVNLNKIGAVINFVYQSLVDDHKETFSVVKLAGAYGKNSEENFIESYERSYDRGRKSPHATSRLKIIYSVRDRDFLFSKCLYSE